MPAGAFSAARKLLVPASFFVTGPDVLDFKDLMNGQTDFRPQGIQIDSSSDPTEESAGYCKIKGTLYGESDDKVTTYTLHTRMPHGLAFRKIWSTGTTGRGIKLLSEI